MFSTCSIMTVTRWLRVVVAVRRPHATYRARKARLSQQCQDVVSHHDEASTHRITRCKQRLLPCLHRELQATPSHLPSSCSASNARPLTCVPRPVPRVLSPFDFHRENHYLRPPKHPLVSPISLTTRFHEAQRSLSPPI